MPYFSEESKKNLSECHIQLQFLFNEVIKYYDCSIIQGYRNEETQNLYFATKKSKVQFPNSKHNKNPSEAVDVAPFPIDWNDKERFILFAGRVEGIAKAYGIEIRWGGNWDRDDETKDNNFNDLVHFELYNPPKIWKPSIIINY